MQRGIHAEAGGGGGGARRRRSGVLGQALHIQPGPGGAVQAGRSPQQVREGHLLHCGPRRGLHRLPLPRSAAATAAVEAVIRRLII